MKLVVEHLRGARKGQRQELELVDSIKLGRHPQNQVAFDVHRDLDVSSWHAEIRFREGVPTLFDVGSANGTRVAGQLCKELTLQQGIPLEIELGTSGPVIRILLGEGEMPGPAPAAKPSRMVIVLAIIAVAVVTLALALFR